MQSIVELNTWVDAVQRVVEEARDEVLDAIDATEKEMEDALKNI